MYKFSFSGLNSDEADLQPPLELASQKFDIKLEADLQSLPESGLWICLLLFLLFRPLRHHKK
jgi:hypothetical protein